MCVSSVSNVCQLDVSWCRVLLGGVVCVYESGHDVLRPLDLHRVVVEAVDGV